VEEARDLQLQGREPRFEDLEGDGLAHQTVALDVADGMRGALGARRMRSSPSDSPATATLLGIAWRVCSTLTKMARSAMLATPRMAIGAETLSPVADSTPSTVALG
jgi:hypothetical protein